jgi:hypothetical protein
MCDQKPVTFGGLSPCDLRRLLNAPGSAFVPSTLGPDPLPPSTCCWGKPQCQKLKVVVIAPPPWGPQPGAPSSGGCSDPTKNINAIGSRCQVPITGGAPWCARVTGLPAAVSGKVPEDVARAYPTFVPYMRVVEFNFGMNVFPEAEGKVLASIRSGCANATLKFIYRWCGPQTCNSVVLPAFEVTSNYGVNARFTVLDDVSFLSSDVCTPSAVVVQLQQWCDDGITNPRDPALAILDAPWKLESLTCLDATAFATCPGTPCFAPTTCGGGGGVLE